MNWTFDATDRPELLAAIYLSGVIATALLFALLVWLSRRYRM